GRAGTGGSSSPTAATQRSSTTASGRTAVAVVGTSARDGASAGPESGGRPASRAASPCGPAPQSPSLYSTLTAGMPFGPCPLPPAPLPFRSAHAAKGFPHLNAILC